MEDKLGITVQDHKQRLIGPRVRVGPNRVNSNGHCADDPEVRIIREGNQIQSIVIACKCGEQITVICGYDETPRS